MLEEVLNLLKNDNVFLTGGAGVGKSYLTQNIIKEYKNNGKNVITLGSTGISAINIGGVSIHSFFKFGICSDFNELNAYDRRQKESLKKVYEILKIADLIVIDEISMVSASLLEMIRLRLMVSKFKGKLLVVGDFYQLPPIKKDESKNALFSFKYAFDAHAWSDFKFKNVELRISKRTNDLEFYEILKQIRIGNTDKSVISYINNLRIKDYLLDENTTILFGRNDDANRINQTMLDRLETPLETSLAQISVLDESVNEDAVLKWVNQLNAPAKLDFKIGAKVIFVQNYPLMGYHNGERGRVIQIDKFAGDIERVIIQKDNGVVLDVKKQLFSYTKFQVNGDELDQSVLATFSQFPFKLAYALTIHKSQGMSINGLICQLNHIFANGQLYVALSRATSPENLRLIYSKNSDFEGYLRRVIKIDDDVRKFYEQTQFINVKEF